MKLSKKDKADTLELRVKQLRQYITVQELYRETLESKLKTQASKHGAYKRAWNTVNTLNITRLGRLALRVMGVRV